MTWFKTDDGFYDHPKVSGLSWAARGLWITAGSYCAKHLTDGYVPGHLLARGALGPSKGLRSATTELVAAGLWTTTQRDGQPGYQFHDWDEYQPRSEQVQANRAATAERVRRHRNARNGNAVTNAVSNGVSNRTPTRPVPSSLREEEGTGPAARKRTDGGPAPKPTPRSPWDIWRDNDGANR